MNLFVDTRKFTPALKWVKRWCCRSMFDPFECYAFKNLESALKFFRRHEGFRLLKLEVSELELY